jgi:3',5'-cyclic AMP phosphodiesterase CpdA
VDTVIGVVTDLHFGPEARFEGKLRKLSHRAGTLLEAFVARMNREVRPSLVVNLGDDIEDESLEADRARYGEAMQILAGLEAPVLHVAGNHDTIHLDAQDLLAAWGASDPAGRASSLRRQREPRLYGSFDHGGLHVVVLHTRERKDVDVRIDEEQLAWLAEDLEQAASPTVVFMHHAAADMVLVGNRWFERAAHICLVQERRALRSLLERSGKVLAVVNGHLHWNHFALHGGVPYFTLQSLIENLDDDAPGRPAAAHAVLRFGPRRLLVEIEGAERARYQLERPRGGLTDPFGVRPEG